MDAVEPGARADLLTELRAAVEGLATTRSVPLKALPTGPQDWSELVSRAAVLALLESLPVPDRPVELDVAALDLIRRFPSPDGATWWNEERLAFLARLAEAPDGR